MTEYIAEIEATDAKLMASINGLTEEQSKFKINPNVWSIHECMEHIVIVEVGIYRLLCKETAGTASRVAEHDEMVGKVKIAAKQADRTVKRQAPVNVQPMGRFSNLDELRAKFHENRQRICDGLKNNEFVFDNQLYTHPIVGELTKKDWLNFMIHHTERHRAQIEEIKASVGFNIDAKSL